MTRNKFATPTGNHSFVTLIENRTRLWQEMVSAPLSDRPNQFLSVATDERSVSIRENRFYRSNRHVVSHMVRLQRRHQNCGKVMLSVMSVSVHRGCLHVINIPDVLDLAMQESSLIYYEACAVGKRAVRILQEGFLVKTCDYFQFSFKQTFQTKAMTFNQDSY